MNFTTAVVKPEQLAGLTERRFRGYWRKTAGTERERFAAVAALLVEGIPHGLAAMHAKPGVRKAVIEAIDDGSWYKVQEILATVHQHDPVKWVISHNLHRRHLSPSQKAMVADKMREYFDQRAKERMSAGGKAAGNGRQKKGVENLPHPNAKSRDQAGAAVGVSGKLIDAAKTVRTRGSPELVKKVESGEVSVTKAAKVAATVPREQQAHAVEQPAGESAITDSGMVVRPGASKSRGWNRS